MYCKVGLAERKAAVPVSARFRCQPNILWKHKDYVGIPSTSHRDKPHTNTDNGWVAGWVDLRTSGASVMARTLNRLTVNQIKAAKGKQMLPDGGGLYLQVTGTDARPCRAART